MAKKAPVNVRRIVTNPGRKPGAAGAAPAGAAPAGGASAGAASAGGASAGAASAGDDAGDDERIASDILGGVTFEEPTGGADEGAKRKPGRPKGRTSSYSPRGSSPKKEAVQTSLEGIEGILLSCHMMLAQFSKIPELELSKEEAEKLATAIAQVAALYDVGASEKTLAWVNLSVCIGGIYGTRAFAYSLRTRAEEAEKNKKTVLQFAPSGGSTI